MRKRIIADSILLFVTFVWGVTFVIVQDAIIIMPVFAFLSVRFLLAGALLFLPVLFISSQRKALFDRNIWRVGGMLGFWLFAGYALQTIGLLYTTPGKAGFITGLYVVMVPILSIFVLRSMPSKFAWLGVVAATVGLFLLAYNRSGGVNIGDVLEFFCAVSFTVQIVFVGKHTQRFASLPITAIQITIVGVLSLVAGLVTHVDLGTSLHALTNTTVINAVWINVLLATVLAYIAQMAFQKFTTATRTALVFSMEPVFAALSAYVLIRETMTPSALVGAALILAGMLVAEFGGGEHAVRDST